MKRAFANPLKPRVRVDVNLHGRLSAAHHRISTATLAVLLLWAAGMLAGLAAPLPARSAGEVDDPVTADSLNVGRMRHTATLLTNGRVLVAGGYNFGQTPAQLASVEIYNPQTDIWTDAEPMHYSHEDHTATMLLDGRVLMAGGRDAAGRSIRCEIYDPQTDTWLVTGSLEARANHTATLLSDGRVLVTGGYSSANTPFASAQIFNLATNSWSSAGNMHHARVEHAAALLANGWVLVVGGVDASDNYLTSAEIYNPITNQWTEVEPLTTGRAVHSATRLYDGRVVVAGGATGLHSYTPTIEVYDVAADDWTSAQSMDPAQSGHTANLLPNGNVIFTAGYTGSHSGGINGFNDATNQGFGVEQLNQPRQMHTSTLLPDGRLLVVGGEYVGLGALASVEILDLKESSTSGGDTLNTGRSRHEATLLLDGRVLLTGGFSASALASVEDYTWQVDDWRALPAMGTARSSHTQTLLNDGRVLVAGGDTGGGQPPTASAELFIPHANSWSPAGSLGTARTTHTATLLPDGRVLVAGGFSGISHLTSAEIFDPAANTWSPAAGMSSARSRHTATLLTSGLVLVAGGYGPAGALSGCELYNPQTNSWSSTDSLNAARFNHAATLMPNGRVLVTGGSDSGGTALASAEVYSRLLMIYTWTYTDDMSEARNRHSSTLLRNGQVLIAGGEAGSVYRDKVELYDPGLKRWSGVNVADDLLNRRIDHSATLLPDGSVLIAGGYYDSAYLPQTERYRFELPVDPTDHQPKLQGIKFISPTHPNLLEGGDLRGYPYNEGSGGDASQSAANYPLVQLLRLDSQETRWIDLQAFGSETVRLEPAAEMTTGPALLTVFVNGMPSISQIVRIGNAVYLPFMRR